jgi:hypothetical protein
MWLLSLIPWLGKAFDLAGTITKITDKIVQLKIEQANAVTERQRIEAGEAIKVLEAQRDIKVAQAERVQRIDAFVRIGFATPVALYLWKLLVWDKVLNALTDGSTDDLTNNQWWVVFVVVGFYFAGDVAKVFKR